MCIAEQASVQSPQPSQRARSITITQRWLPAPGSPGCGPLASAVRAAEAAARAAAPAPAAFRKPRRDKGVRLYRGSSISVSLFRQAEELLEFVPRVPGLLPLHGSEHVFVQLGRLAAGERNRLFEVGGSGLAIHVLVVLDGVKGRFEVDTLFLRRFDGRVSLFTAQAGDKLGNEREVGVGEFVGGNGVHVALRRADLLKDLVGGVAEDSRGLVSAGAVFTVAFAAVEGEQLLALRRRGGAALTLSPSLGGSRS